MYSNKERYTYMSKQFWGILIAIVVIFFGVVLINNHKSDNQSASNAKPTHHVEGNTASNVTLVEYGDYQCPVCESFYSATKQTEEKYKDQIAFQFRNLPLSSMHPNAFAAARAAEAAGLQGKFWQMHDTLYDAQNYQEWAYDASSGAVTSSDPTSFFNAYAKQLGLNLTKFDKDMKSAKVNNAINADLAAFKKTGDEEATPTYYLNGKKLDNQKLVGSDGTPNVDAFSKVIDAALAAQKK